jgi:hypothetical protein
MTDRANRLVVTGFGLVLLIGGGLAALQGAAVFGDHRSNTRVVTSTVVRWWREGGWMSFAVVGAIGATAIVIGAVVASKQFGRNDGRVRASTLILEHPDGTRGETTLRAPALSHNLETDLKRIPDVRDAAVGLFGQHPGLELRTVLTVGDSVDLEELPARVSEVLARMQTMTGAHPNPIQVTVRFESTPAERRLT